MVDFGELGTSILRLACALTAGGILGLEREMSDKPAGLRTNMLVALGAALLVLVGLQLASLDGTSPSGVELSRIIQGIVGGIGFLGAGTIIQSRNSVHGLTTASALWLSAALGVSSGLGLYALTFATVLLGLVVLGVLGFVESRFLRQRGSDGHSRSDSTSNRTE